MIFMVDFYVDSDELLGSGYYVTSLECDNYNPNIDSTVDVTVTVKDVYDDPVVGEVVTVTASQGSFIELNSESITAAASVDGTTDASGQFTLTYQCSQWGLITFYANNTTIQINVQAIQVQHIQTDYKSCGSLYSQDVTATVTSLPTGYSYLFVPENSYRSVTRITGVSGTTASFNVTNVSNSTQNVAAVGWLIYFPSNFNL